MEVGSPPMPRIASLAHFRGILAANQFEEVIKMVSAPSFPFLTGGDWNADLSNDDLYFNAILSTLVHPLRSPSAITLLKGLV